MSELIRSKGQPMEAELSAGIPKQELRNEEKIYLRDGIDMKKQAGRILLCLSIALGLYNSLQAQPYLYYWVLPSLEDTSYLGSPYANAGINRIDLSTNSEEVYFEEYGRINQVLSNSLQDLLFVQHRNVLDIFTSDKQDNIGVTFFSSDWVSFIMDAVLLNRIYLVSGDPGFPDKIVILNRTNFSVLDTLNSFRDYYLGPRNFDKYFFSANQQVIYDHKNDSTGFYFNVFDSFSGSIINDNFKCGDSGPFPYGPTLEYGKDGKALLVWDSASGFLFQHYTWCDLDNNSEGATIRFPWRSKAYLSPLLEEVIIERVDWIYDLPLGEEPELHTGDIYIFDYETGLLKNYLKLPKGGQILLYDSHPDYTFYFVGGENYSSYEIDLNQVITNIAFTDTLETFRFRSCEELEWANDAGVCEELEDDLSEVKTALETEDSLAAANALAKFIALVEAEKNASLTSEGYALLYFNAEYLADRLTKPK